MSVRPVVRHFIACKKEPTANGDEITLNDIFLYAIKPKPPFQYPVWHKPFFLFAIVTNGLGRSTFAVELRLVEWADDDVKERETFVGGSKPASVDFGVEKLKAWPLSIMMPPVLLPHAGIYRLYLICDGQEIAREEILAR